MLLYLFSLVIVLSKLDFIMDQYENCTRLDYCSVSNGNSLQTFRDSLSSPSSEVKFLTPEEGTVRLS